MGRSATAARADASAAALTPDSAALDVPAATRGPHASHPWIIAFAAVVIAVVGFTVLVSVSAFYRKQDQEDLSARIADAREKGGARAVVTALEEFLATDPRGRVQQIATQELNQARRITDDEDYQKIAEANGSSDGDLERLQTELQAYLDGHADGAHRGAAEERLQRIPARRDDSAYEQTARRAQAAGDDFAAQKAAWEAYLQEYPQGRNILRARAKLAELPEREEDVRLRKLLARAKEFSAAKQWPDALDCLERGAGDLRSAARQQQVRAAAKEIEARLEELDAARCLQTAGERGANPQNQLAACQLYLLCYPSGARRAEVERKIQALQEAMRKEELARIRQRISALEKEPLKALLLLAEVRERPEFADADWTGDILQLNWRTLRDTLDASLPGTKVLRLENDTQLLGAIRSENETIVQFAARPTDGTSKPKTALLPRKSIRSITDAPTATEWLRVRAEVEALLARAETRSASIASNVRQIQMLLSGEAYRAERLACQALLAALDPQETEARQALSKAGYADRGVVWAPPNTPNASKPVEAVTQAFHRMVDAFTAQCKLQAEQAVAEKMKALPKSFEYTLLGTSITVRVQWSHGDADAKAAVTPGDTASAEITIQFPLSPSRDKRAALPASIAERADERLAAANGASFLHFDYEIKTTATSQRGIGLVLEQKAGKIRVRRIIAGTSAEQAGVRVDDQILAINEVWLTPDATPANVDALVANASGAVRAVVGRADRRFRVALNLVNYTVETYQRRGRVRSEAKGISEAKREEKWSEWEELRLP